MVRRIFRHRGAQVPRCRAVADQKSVQRPASSELHGGVLVELAAVDEHPEHAPAEHLLRDGTRWRVEWREAALSIDKAGGGQGLDVRLPVGPDLGFDRSTDGGFACASCAAAAWDASPFVDPRVPPEDDGRWFLIRAAGPSGRGTYGDGSPARPNVRDPLDDSIPACP